MGGFFGAVSKRDCILDVFFGTDYHSHLGTRRGGMAAYDSQLGLQREIHNIENSPFRTKFDGILNEMKGTSAIGCISDTDPQPLLIRSNLGTYAICTIGIPAAAQSAMYNISNIFIQSSMNSFGTSTIAAWGVYGKIDFVFWMTINSLGIAITTFAGQNFGARQYDRVRRGVRVCLAMAACTTLVISFTFYNLAEVLFRLFSQDDAVVAVGVGMMHVLTPVYITYVCIEVLAGALRGCGDVRVPTLITVFFVCGLRMLWLFIAVPIRHEVATVEMSYPITWSLASALFILYYVKGGWMQRCAEKWEKKQAG